MQPTKKYMRGENMRVLLLLRGSAGCGKSTWIEQNGLKQYALSADDIRMMCSSPQMMPDGTHAISQANDNIVWKTLFNILETRMKNGEFTVIDATNSKTSEMNRYKKMCDEYRYRIYCVDMTTVPIEVTKERNRGRQELKRVPEEVIDKMYARFETQKIPSGIKVIQPDELNAVLVKLNDEISPYCFSLMYLFLLSSRIHSQTESAPAATSSGSLNTVFFTSTVLKAPSLSRITALRLPPNSTLPSRLKA